MDPTPPSESPGTPSRGPAVDMSPEAVDARIRELSDLWDLWIRLELDRIDGKLTGPGVRTGSEVTAFLRLREENPDT